MCDLKKGGKKRQEQRNTTTIQTVEEQNEGSDVMAACLCGGFTQSISLSCSLTLSRTPQFVDATLWQDKATAE